MKKKAQIGNLQAIIAVLIIVGVLLAVGFFILEEFLDQLDNNSFTVSSEAGWVNESGYTIDRATAIGFNSPVITGLWNDTRTYDPSIANITSAGVITNGTAIELNDTSVRINYTYQGGTNSYKGLNDTIQAMLTIPELLGLIVLIAMIGVILAVIFNVIPGSRTQGA